MPKNTKNTKVEFRVDLDFGIVAPFRTSRNAEYEVTAKPQSYPSLGKKGQSIIHRIMIHQGTNFAEMFILNDGMLDFIDTSSLHDRITLKELVEVEEFVINQLSKLKEYKEFLLEKDIAS